MEPAMTTKAARLSDLGGAAASRGDTETNRKGAIMAKIALGNHSALRVRRADREKIRSFYRDVLGCRITRELDDKDDVRLGDDFHISFLYGSGSADDPTKGVTYAAADVLPEGDFLKAIFLELKTDDVDDTRRRIVASGVRLLDVPDPHLYFQAPGGQVFRLVGIGEDLSKYEGNG
jgi:catechol 2,3-dioxygenase-like lactoylglutathione lyase family enzyme